MAERIEQAAVLGAGVMGSAIAAHLAGAGIRTHLLDIVPRDVRADDARDRSRFAIQGIDKALKAKPATFFTPEAAPLVTPGNFEDDLERLRGCDLVIEAVVENLDVKCGLFKRIAPHLRPDVILASNTSGLSLVQMTEALSEPLRSRFVVMHFFNPVRYMHLLEIVPGPKTSAEVVARAAGIGEALGKGIVYGKDTPNFVANRIGVHGLMLTMQLMQQAGYGIEEVDAIAGRPMGRPNSAAFQTCDIVGIDTMIHVANNCYDALPNDEERDVFKMPNWVVELATSGRTGRKTGAGFYKKVGDDILVLDPATLDYRPRAKVRMDSLGAVKGMEDVRQRLKHMAFAEDRGGQLAWQLLSRSLCYTARRLGEIADNIVNIDRAMRWGFNWDLGPFETWDAIGVRESVARMKKDGLQVPAWVVAMVESGRTSFYGGAVAAPTYYDVGRKAETAVPKDPRALSLAARKSNKRNIIKENMGASVVDLGDGCLGVEFHTKLNTLDSDVIEMLGTAVDEAERNFEAVVIGNEGEHFCAGANLMMIFMAAQGGAFDQIEQMVRGLQAALQRVRFARVPVVAAPFQYTLGGGAEVAMACTACQAYAETYMGLVEVGVGLIPAGGGLLRLVERFTQDAGQIQGADLLPYIGTASLQVAMAKVATSADEAKALRYLRATDGISLNRDHLLAHAKARALGLAAADYRPPRPPRYKALGLDAAKTIGARVWGMVEGGYASAHDAVIANKIAYVLCGGNVAAGTELSEQAYLDLECEAFLSLCGEDKTKERVQHMLMNNKPLRN